MRLHVQENAEWLYDDDDDDRAIIYGCDYDFLSDEIAKIMNAWNITESADTTEYSERTMEELKPLLKSVYKGCEVFACADDNFYSEYTGLADAARNMCEEIKKVLH